MEEKLLMTYEEAGKKDANPAAVMSWAGSTEMIFMYVMFLAFY